MKLLRMYIGGSSREWEACAFLINKARQLGVIITFDWTESFATGSTNASLTPNQAVCYATADQDAVGRADVFVARMPNPGTPTTGLHTELGIALESRRRCKSPEIWVIGSPDSNIFLRSADRFFRHESDFVKEIEEMKLWSPT